MVNGYVLGFFFFLNHSGETKYCEGLIGPSRPEKSSIYIHHSISVYSLTLSV